MKRFKILLPVCQYAVFSIALYFIINIILKSLIGFSIDVFASLPTLIDYPGSHPISFILMNCLTFFLTQITLSKLLNKIKYRVLRYLFFYLFWLMTTCLLGGLLGSYYDMENGWYPAGKQLYAKLYDDMLFGGFGYGLYVIIFSIPYNIIVFIGSFFILKYNKVLDKKW